ncbi:MAG TPA: hypothetical protein VE604_03085 [Candidatus Polarisedimenticolia bacterium]|jgi:hypothetical protein|nr:hypothetical protein [Candidatus Polarisedimenticolia bacterium]
MLLEVFDLRRRKPPAAEPDRLLDQLHQVERDLKKWIGRSSRNADLFRRDPLGAMRAAGLNLEDDIMLELEMISRSIAKKLK